MAYQIGSVITAADFNSFLTRVNNIYSTGTGTSGYGMPSLLANVTAGTVITSAHWQALRTMIQRCAAHQSTAVSSLPPTASLAQGSTVYAHVNGSGNNAYDFAGLISAIEANKLLFSTDMVLTSSAYSLTKTTTWSGTIQGIVEAAWPTEEAARLFFNTGGEIRIRLAASGALASSGVAQDADWRSVIGKAGTFRIQASAFATTATAGSVGNGGYGGRGYQSLNSSYATIYDGSNMGSTPYGANDVIYSAYNVGARTNGANGNAMRMAITLQDEHSNVYYDSVSAGMQVHFDVLRVDTTNLPSAITAPTFSTLQAF